jgi:hypothetical protein
MFYIVEFHADGGQMCVPGIRCFDSVEKANAFAERLRNEPGHTCGPNSVRQRESETPIENHGVVYPGVANMGRTAVIIDGKLHLC